MPFIPLDLTRRAVSMAGRQIRGRTLALALLAMAAGLALAACTSGEPAEPTPPPTIVVPLPTHTPAPSATVPPTNTPAPTPATPIPDTPGVTAGPTAPATPTPTIALALTPVTAEAPTSTPIPDTPSVTTGPTAPPTPTPTVAPTLTPPPTGGGVPDLVFEEAFPNLDGGVFGGRPLFLTFPPDGSNRVAVVGQEGRIFMLPNDPAVREEQVTQFLDIEDQVSRRSNEEGLLGLAFDPGYAENGLFYVYYSAVNPRRSVISRFQVSADPNRADPSSEEVVLEVPQPLRQSQRRHDRLRSRWHALRWPGRRRPGR